MRENLQNIKIQRLTNFSTESIIVDILRLDLFHPVVSGNKWFKLQFYLAEALSLGKTSIATFGGAYSNHIVATACAAAELGLESVGFIRGGEGGSATLSEAKRYGMQLVLTDRDEYRNKERIREKWESPNRYWIMEGGYGAIGAKGAADILALFETGNYSHILCAVGTGTMMAGLLRGAKPGQKIVGISVLKNHYDLEKEILALLDGVENTQPVTLHHTYHFGGYAKQTPDLFVFMRELWEKEKIPTDLVYTSKLLYGTADLLKNGHFPEGSRLLVIHSGGLQGNRSVPAGVLPFL